MFFLILISALPVFLALLWYRLSRVPLSLPACSFALLAGAAALFPALLLQRLFSGLEFAGAALWSPIADMFIRIALTEESSRLLALLVFFLFSGDLKKQDPRSPEAGEPDLSPAADRSVRGTAVGLLAGLGFAMLESAVYGAADFRVALPRAFTAAPLHGACGARIGSALLIFSSQPRRAVFRFFSAVIIHGVYNIMIVRSGVSSLLAVLIALFALASSALEIRNRSAASQGPAENHPE
jgi:RsiW-degrading membrane proteinase PrsW (M82 family)